MAKKSPKRKRGGASGDGSAVSVDTVIAQVTALRTRATDLVRRIAAGEEAIRRAIADLSAAGDDATRTAPTGARTRATARTTRKGTAARKATTSGAARRPRSGGAPARPRRTRAGGS